jgi:small conductance mechanosensitive channel
MDDAVDLALAIGARLGAAALVLVGGYVLAVAARRLARRLLGRPKVARVLGPSMVRLLGTAVYYFLLALAVGVALVALGVPATVVVTVAVVLIALVGVALQQSLANFAATVIFLLFQPFRRGELVETMGRMGTVEEILLFNTVLRLPDQRLVSLPNSKVQESGVTNYSRMGQVRADFDLTVAYGEDLDRVRAVIAEIAANDARVLAEPPFEVVVDELGENGVRLLAMPTVAPEHFWAVRNDLRERVKARFDAEGIRFAVPPREVRLAAAAPPPAAVAAGGQVRRPDQAWRQPRDEGTLEPSSAPEPDARAG